MPNVLSEVISADDGHYDAQDGDLKDLYTLCRDLMAIEVME